MKQWYVTILLCLHMSVNQAQITLPQLLQGQPPAQAAAYVQPLSDAMVIGLHSAQYPYPCPKQGFHFYLGITTNLVTIPEEAWRFRANVGEATDPNIIELPTVVGSSETASSQNENGTVQLYPGGLELNSILVSTPELRIGTLSGFDFGVRYSNYDYGQLLGRIRVQGFNIRYALVSDIDRDEFFALSIAYDFTSFNVQDALTSSNHGLRLAAGYQSEKFQIGGHGSFVLGIGQISYPSLDSESMVTENLAGTGHLIAGLGTGVTVWKLRIHAEVNIIPRTAYGIGLGLYL